MMEMLDAPSASKVFSKRLQSLRVWCSTTTWGSAPGQQALAAVVAALVIAPQASVEAGTGLDPSWEAVVALARIQHIAWGPQLAFTYGPLGYLQTTAYYTYDQSVLATIYQFSVVGALFLGIAAALRQRYAPMASIVGAFAASGMAAILQVGHGTALGMMYPELAILAALAWAAVPMLQLRPKPPAIYGTCIALGAVAGLQLLVKFNTGLSILIIALTTSVVLGWKALVRHGATVAAFTISAIIWWIIANQRLGDLPSWLKYSTAILSGYNESQAVPLTPAAASAVVLSFAWIGALCVLFTRAGARVPRRLIFVVGVVTLITVKSSFGRYDIWHFSMLLGVIVVAVAIIPFSTMRPRVLAVAAVALSFASVGGEAIVGDRLAATAVQAPVQGVNRLITLAAPGRIDQRIERAKARLRANYAVPQRFIETIGSRRVHIDPDETSVVWAYNLRWLPAPVFATYSAYTPLLDALNSDALRDGPDFVLSRVSATSPATGIDGRLGTQESPLYSRALLCQFALSGVDRHWALFARTRSHCGPLRPISEVDLPRKDPVAVPLPSQPNMAVLAAIDLNTTALDWLFQGTAAPLETFTVTIDGVSYRLVAGNAAEPFLIVTPESANGTNLAVKARTIGVGRSQSLGQGQLNARLRFYEMRVEP